ELLHRTFGDARELRNAIGTDFAHGRLILAEALDAAPRRGEGPRILDVNVRFQLLSALGQTEALDDVKLFRVRRAEAIDPGALVDADRVDDEGVAFVVADRFAVPGRLQVRRMLVGQIDVADLLLAREDHHHLFR